MLPLFGFGLFSKSSLFHFDCSELLPSYLMFSFPRLHQYHHHHHHHHHHHLHHHHPMKSGFKCCFNYWQQQYYYHLQKICYEACSVINNLYTYFTFKQLWKVIITEKEQKNNQKSLTQAFIKNVAIRGEQLEMSVLKRASS